MIGPLPEAAARIAIEKPVRDQGVAIEDEALKRIIACTHCYPYFSGRRAIAYNRRPRGRSSPD
jgi:hypothetical protein